MFPDNAKLLDGLHLPGGCVPVFRGTNLKNPLGRRRSTGAALASLVGSLIRHLYQSIKGLGRAQVNRWSRKRGSGGKALELGTWCRTLMTCKGLDQILGLEVQRCQTSNTQGLTIWFLKQRLHFPRTLVKPQSETQMLVDPISLIPVLGIGKFGICQGIVTGMKITCSFTDRSRIVFMCTGLTGVKRRPHSSHKVGNCSLKMCDSYFFKV